MPKIYYDDRNSFVSQPLTKWELAVLMHTTLFSTKPSDALKMQSTLSTGIFHRIGNITDCVYDIAPSAHSEYSDNQRDYTKTIRR